MADLLGPDLGAAFAFGYIFSVIGAAIYIAVWFSRHGDAIGIGWLSEVASWVSLLVPPLGIVGYVIAWPSAASRTSLSKIMFIVSIILLVLGFVFLAVILPG